MLQLPSDLGLPQVVPTKINSGFHQLAFVTQKTTQFESREYNLVAAISLWCLKAAQFEKPSSKVLGAFPRLPSHKPRDDVKSKSNPCM